MATAIIERLTITIVGLSLLIQPFILGLPVNKYEDMAEGGPPPIDCDGPATIFVLLAPFAIFSAAALIYWIVQLIRAPLPRRKVGAALTSLLLVLLAVKGNEAWHENRRVAAAAQCR